MTNDDKLLEIRAAVERYCRTSEPEKTNWGRSELIFKILDIFGIHSDGTRMASR